MKQFTPINVLPQEVQRDFRAYLWIADDQGQPPEGEYKLVDIRETPGNGYRGQRITVLVVDENGEAIPNVNVAFSYSTAPFITLSNDFKWSPAYDLFNAFVAQTGGSGEIDMVLGADGVVKDGQRGGVAVWVFEPEYPSDVIYGLGMKPDHTGVYCIFQLRRKGIKPALEELEELRNRVDALEAAYTNSTVVLF